MSSGIYNRFKYNLMVGEVDLVDDTVRVALLDSNHSFSAGDNEWADVSSNEIAGTGYTAGGKELTGKSVQQDASTKWDGDNVEWTNASFSAYHAVLYVGDDLIASIDFGGEQVIADGSFSIEWSGSGIITLSEA